MRSWSIWAATILSAGIGLKSAQAFAEIKTVQEQSGPQATDAEMETEFYDYHSGTTYSRTLLNEFWYLNHQIQPAPHEHQSEQDKPTSAKR